MAEIVLCCGKVCSGKSTFAHRLEQAYQYFHFSADEWMLHFYEETSDRAVFERRLEKCKAMIVRLAEKLLRQEHNVVLDFGFWQKSERIAFRKRFEALSHWKNNFENILSNAIGRPVMVNSRLPLSFELDR